MIQGLSLGVLGNNANSDPYWNSVQALLRFNGTTGDSFTLDSSFYNTSVALHDPKGGSSTITGTPRSPFGETCLATNSLGGCTVTGFSGVGLGGNTAMGTSDFTWEGWTYWNLTNRGVAFDTAGPTNSSRGYRVGNFGGSWLVDEVPSPGVGNTIISPTVAILVNSWTHVVWQRRGTSGQLYISGVQIGGDASTSVNCTGYRMGIGIDLTNNGDLQGYLSQFRITKGYARYSGNFTPPTAPWPT